MDNKEIFQQQSAWGFKTRTGYWEIDLGETSASFALLNEATIKMIDHFLDAFSSLCVPVEVRYDHMFFNEDGKLEAIREGESRKFETKDRALFMETVRAIFAQAPRSFISNLFVECAINITVPPGLEIDKQLLLPGAGKLYLGYVLEPNWEDELVPVECVTSFETDIDVWLAQTKDASALGEHDNKAFAALNAPVLEASLKAWESLTGKPISDWSSRYYKDLIYKYGFRNEND